MDVLREKIKKKCEEILLAVPNKIQALRDIDTYLMNLYMDQELNGFSKLSIIQKDGKECVFFGVQLPGFHGMNGWVDVHVFVPNTTKAFADYDRAMSGI